MCSTNRDAIVEEEEEITDNIPIITNNRKDIKCTAKMNLSCFTFEDYFYFISSFVVERNAAS